MKIWRNFQIYLIAELFQPNPNDVFGTLKNSDTPSELEMVDVFCEKTKFEYATQPQEPVHNPIREAEATGQNFTFSGVHAAISPQYR